MELQWNWHSGRYSQIALVEYLMQTQEFRKSCVRVLCLDVAMILAQTLRQVPDD